MVEGRSISRLSTQTTPSGRIVVFWREKNHGKSPFAIFLQKVDLFALSKNNTRNRATPTRMNRFISEQRISQVGRGEKRPLSCHLVKNPLVLAFGSC